MIALLKGTIAEKHPDHVVVDVGGVGYRVFVSLMTYYGLGNEGDRVNLSIYTHVREDQIHLFGFADASERRMFNLLNCVTGIGPKLALNILSGKPVRDLAAAIFQEAHNELTKIPGLGKKTAQRLVLELKDKVEELAKGGPLLSDAPVRFNTIEEDVLSALTNLGYNPKVAQAALTKVKVGQPDCAGVEELLRESLKTLGKGK